MILFCFFSIAFVFGSSFFFRLGSLCSDSETVFVRNDFLTGRIASDLDREPFTFHDQSICHSLCLIGIGIKIAVPLLWADAKIAQKSYGLLLVELPDDLPGKLRII